MAIMINILIHTIVLSYLYIENKLIYFVNFTVIYTHYYLPGGYQAITLFQFDRSIIDKDLLIMQCIDKCNELLIKFKICICTKL